MQHSINNLQRYSKNKFPSVISLHYIIKIEMNLPIYFNNMVITLEQEYNPIVYYNFATRYIVYLIDVEKIGV